MNYSVTFPQLRVIVEVHCSLRIYSSRCIYVGYLFPTFSPIIPFHKRKSFCKVTSRLLHAHALGILPPLQRSNPNPDLPIPNKVTHPPLKGVSQIEGWKFRNHRKCSNAAVAASAAHALPLSCSPRKEVVPKLIN